MKYQMNVDLEQQNVANGPGIDCKSELHSGHGLHYDITIHAIGCSCRNSRAVNRPPSRYWDDNEGKGYSLDEILAQLRAIRDEHQAAYPRRCSLCGVEEHLPDWD